MAHDQWGVKILQAQGILISLLIIYRYIYTSLNTLTRLIFKEEDDHVYTYLEDDGMVVEPKYYCGILPMLLVNGCEGIGTGWSTSIPPFNLKELVQ